MKTVCDLLKLLNNPHRLRLLQLIYSSRDGGANVGVLSDAFDGTGLKVSGVSQYLAQLEDVGVIRRERCGRYVNYLADARYASAAVAEATDLILKRMKVSEPGFLEGLSLALMNPFRARVTGYLAAGGAGDTASICERYNHQAKHLRRDLQPAIDSGILAVDDDNPVAACYSLADSLDDFTLAIIRLAAD